MPTSVTVILLDALNTHFIDMAYARGQVKKFLKQLRPGDRVALYGLSNELYVLHDFTQDADSLLRALDDSKNTENFHVGASEETPADTGDDNVDAFMDQASHQIAEYANIDRADLTAQALEAIADHLAGMPGRKNLVWVSGAFPINMTGDTALEWISFQRRDRRGGARAEQWKHRGLSRGRAGLDRQRGPQPSAGRARPLSDVCTRVRQRRE